MAGRWCVPPAMLRDPSRMLAAAGILEESAGDLGVMLWRTARDVELWADTPQSQRNDLFPEGSADVRVARLAGTDTPSEIAASIATINGMLVLGARGDASIITLGCLEVAAWARRMGYTETAVAFAQAGALSSPLFSEAALQTGIAAREAQQVVRGETWLRRALAVARYERNRPAYASALVELGLMAEFRDDIARAQRLYRRAFRAARRYPDRSARARAAHRLFRLAMQQGDAMEAAQFALATQRTFVSGTQAAPLILLDLARFWLELDQSEKVFAAVRQLWPVREQLPSSKDRLEVAAFAARCCPDVHYALRTAAVDEAWRLMDDLSAEDPASCVGPAMHLAHAARLTGNLADFSRAKRAVLTFAPGESFIRVAEQVTDIWPDGSTPARAS